MKQVTLKAVLSATTLLAAASYGMAAQAHCIGQGSLNFPVNTTITTTSPSPLQYDKYLTVCPTGTVGAQVRISKAGGAAGVPITAELSKDTAPADGTTVVATDNSVLAATACNAGGGEAIGAGAGGFVTLNRGAGTYEIIVSKDEGALPAAKGYVAEFHCLPLAVDAPVQVFLQAGGDDFNRVANH